MRKQKDLNVDSKEWIAAWKRMLNEGFIMRCLIEQRNDTFRFWMESFVVIGDFIHRIRFERFLGDTVGIPMTHVGYYGDSVETLLTDFERWWVGEGAHNYLTIQEIKLAVPHRGFIRPLGSADVFLLPTNHPLLMTNYGAVLEWLYLAQRGRVTTGNHAMKPEDEKALWKIFEPRFKKFLYQQQVSLLQSMTGRVVSVQYG